MPGTPLRHARVRCAAAIAAGTLALIPALPGHAAADPFVECQHPVRTGVEVSHLRNVLSRRACRLALDLFAWEARPGNAARLYGCTTHPGLAYLRRRVFEGWGLSLGRSGAFVMSRRHSSFDVSGTDFPLNCT